MARILGLKQLHQKRYILMAGLSKEIQDSFGELASAFTMIVWGLSGNGKSNFLMQFIRALMPFGKVLYISYEEGTEKTMQNLVFRHLNLDEHAGRIEFADYTMTLDELIKKLKRKKSPQFIVVDSLQYAGFTYQQYKLLKETFPRKAFLFISHATGKLPTGKTAIDIRYDTPIKVLVQGYIAFVHSRFGGIQNFVIWKDGAKEYWGKKYKQMLTKRL